MRPIPALAVLVAIAFLVVPAAAAHSLPGVVTVPTGTPPSLAAPAPRTSSGALLDTVFAQEVAVTLSDLPRGTGAAWENAPTTEYDLRFVCPDLAEGTGLPEVPGQETPRACPAYVLDTEDIMGQPDLAIDPRDISLVAFHALHGGPGLRTPLQDPLPSDRSRADAVHQPHTTFQSRDGGSEWEDNRYYAPAELRGQNLEVFGEDNALELDSKGNVNLASLYSFRKEQGDEPQYIVYLWESGRIKQTVDYTKGSVSRTIPAGLRADSLDLAWHADAKEMVVAWRTLGPEGPRVHVEHKAPEGQWVELAADQAERIGPCDALSNLASVGKRVLFACAEGSDTRLFGLASNWTIEDLGLAPLHGLTSLRIASAESLRDDGLVMAGATAREGRTVFTLAWGVAGKDWGRPTEHGAALTTLGTRNGDQLVESHITALAVLGTSGTAHFLVQERFAGGSGAADSRIFGKTYGVVQATGRFLGTFGIGYGDPASRAQVPATVSGTTLGAYHDTHDGMVVVQGKLGEERLFIAFGDYGYVRYAEVVEVEPMVPVFPPIAAPAAIPTLTAATSPVLVAAAAGALSMAAVSRIVLARSKKSVEVQA